MAQSKVGTVSKRPIKVKLFAPAGAPPLKKPAARKVVKKSPHTIKELRAEARRLSNKAYRARKKTEALNKLDDGSNAFDIKTGKPVRLVVRGKHSAKPVVRNPSHLVNGNRYPIERLPAGKHQDVRVRVVGEGPYSTVFYALKDGRIFYNGRNTADLVMDSQFGPKEISAVYQLGGPAPKEVKRAREEYRRKRAEAHAETLKPNLAEAALALGFTHLLDKAGKKTSIARLAPSKAKGVDVI